MLWDLLTRYTDMDRADARSIVSLPLYSHRIALAFHAAAHNAGRPIR